MDDASGGDAAPTLTRIVAIRHGETAWNAQSRLQGQLDIALNATGHAQAARLAAALADEGLAAVVSSDLARAWSTAQAFAQPLGLPLHAEPGLRERHFGDVLQGLTYAEIDARHPALAARWRARDPAFEPPGGGESLQAFEARCIDTAARWARRFRGRAIALVAHGGVLDMLHRAATRQPLDAPRSWTLGNAAIQRLLHSDEGFTLVGWDDQRHLERLDVGDEQG